MITVSVKGGDWQFKEELNLFFFHISIPTVKGTLNGKSFSFNVGLNFKYSTKIKNNISLDFSVVGDVAAIDIRIFDVVVYTHEFKLDDLIKNKSYTVKGFSDFGVNLSDITFVL